MCLGLLDLQLSCGSFFSQSWLLPPVMLAPWLKWVHSPGRSNLSPGLIRGTSFPLGISLARRTKVTSITSISLFTSVSLVEAAVDPPAKVYLFISLLCSFFDTWTNTAWMWFTWDLIPVFQAHGLPPGCTRLS